ncbi:MAG: hypothetical protein H6958_04350 [Chromatiaceae bacterium]|nr:hypothetical protein [Chromatiaceae bacterium]
MRAETLPAVEELTTAPAEPTTDITEEQSAAATEPQWIEHVIASGESLARIFAEQGLDAGLLHRIVTSSKEAESLAQIRPGQQLRFQFDENRELAALEWHRNRVESVTFSISDDEIVMEQVSKALENRIASAAGIIESSLFVDGQKAGLSDGQIMKLAAISAGTSISRWRYAPATISASCSRNSTWTERNCAMEPSWRPNSRIVARPIGLSVTKTATVKSVTTTVTATANGARLSAPQSSLHASVPATTPDAGIRCCRNGGRTKGSTTQRQSEHRSRRRATGASHSAARKAAMARR